MRFVVLTHRRYIGRRRIGDQVALAGLQLGITHRGIGRDREDQRVDLDFALIEGRVGLVTDHRVFLVALELERAGADRFLVDLLGRAGLQHGVGIFLGFDRGEIHRHVGQEWRLRAVEYEAHRVFVHLLDRLQGGRHVHVVEVGVVVASHLEIGVVGLPLALEAEDHVVGIEVVGRFEGLGRLPLHPGAQVEGVGEPIGSDVPALR